MRSTGKAIILNNGKILLNKCNDSFNGCYYTLPGGGQNAYETLSETITRECLEETGYDVKAERFAGLCELICDDEDYRKRYPVYSHKMYNIFVCSLKSNAKVAPTETDSCQSGCEWIDLDNLSEITILPKCINDNIKEMIDNESPKFLGSWHLEHTNG